MGYNKAGRQFAYTPQKGAEMMIWSKTFGWIDARRNLLEHIGTGFRMDCDRVSK